VDYRPFPASLRDEMMALQAPGDNEIHREAMAANGLVRTYADCVAGMLRQSGISAAKVRAIGAHGQTIRHRPEHSYTRQTNNPALLAELTGIDVVADFRSRDVAAGGQGAPLVPAFHQAVFGNEQEARVIVNVGGIGNISILNPDKGVLGFDTGPGNVLMDAWIKRHHGMAYDANGEWASTGTVIPQLLAAMLKEPYLTLQPPKSTGRDLFYMAWLDGHLRRAPNAAPADVQATLTALTAVTLADAIAAHAPAARGVYVCGGGCHNTHLMALLQQALVERGTSATVHSTASLGVTPTPVEARACAWLAYRQTNRAPGNLSSVTGAKGSRILGALYPA
jgi:anhydro-N-acetylmuramic acid kinase